MADSIISQFRREYNAPIETERQVQNIVDRDNINTSRRWQGMLVHVISENTTYSLGVALDNTAWEPLLGLADAPSNGMDYVRKDGAWSLLPASGGLEIIATINDTVTQLGNGTLITGLGNMVIPANTLAPGVILEGKIGGLVRRVTGTPNIRLYVLDNIAINLNLTGWSGQGGFTFEFLIQLNAAGTDVSVVSNGTIIQYQYQVNSTRGLAQNLNVAKNVFLGWNAAASEDLIIHTGYIKKIK
jgi:hypothetical protein